MVAELKIRRVIADLDQVNRASERDFLKIADKLADVAKAANVIASGLQVLGNLISGEEGRDTSETLARALAGCQEIKSRAEESHDLLDRMRLEAENLQQNLAGFKETVATFQRLSLLARIERARLGETGDAFGSLADDVRELAGQIKARVSGSLENAGLLDVAISTVSESEDKQAVALQSLIASVLADLYSLGGIQTRLHESFIRFGHLNELISQNINHAILSLQTHDITRQKIEHVMAALQSLCSGCEEGSDSYTAVVALQSRQLADAEGQLTASVSSIVQTIEQLAEHVLDMAGESRSMFGLAGDETVFLKTEREFAGMVAGLDNCAAAQAAAATVSRSLVVAIDRTSGNIDEIRDTEFQLEQLAINARICAGRLGSSGDVLGILSTSLLQMAFGCARRFESLTCALGFMRPVAMRLSGEDVSALSVVLERTREAVLELHSWSQRSSRQMGQIINCGDVMHRDLAETRKNFSAGALVTEGVARAREALAQVVAETSGSMPGDLIFGSEGNLDHFATRYTMSSEREVHYGVAEESEDSVELF